MRKLFFLLFISSITTYAQKSIIQNGDFEEYKKGTNLNSRNELSKNVLYWKWYTHGSFEITHGSAFIFKKHNRFEFFSCSYNLTEERSKSVSPLKGKGSVHIATPNVEDKYSDYYDRLNGMVYIANELDNYKKIGVYQLDFLGVIKQSSRNVLSDSTFYQKDRDLLEKVIEKIRKSDNPADTVRWIPKNWDCQPTEDNLLKTTFLFTNTLPEGELFRPQEGDFYLDTVINSNCEKIWEKYHFEFNLMKHYKYFIIGYLPKEKKNDEKLCNGKLHLALDDFSLIFQRKIK